MLPGSGNPLVFVVDDEPAIALTLSMILQKEGFETRPFTDLAPAKRTPWLAALIAKGKRR
jgi:DNA-binding response OmpR family regulator